MAYAYTLKDACMLARRGDAVRMKRCIAFAKAHPGAIDFNSTQAWCEPGIWGTVYGSGKTSVPSMYLGWATPLGYAVAYGHETIVKLLLKNRIALGLDINAKSGRGPDWGLFGKGSDWTPLDCTHFIEDATVRTKIDKAIRAIPGAAEAQPHPPTGELAALKISEVIISDPKAVLTFFSTVLAPAAAAIAPAAALVNGAP